MLRFIIIFLAVVLVVHYLAKSVLRMFAPKPNRTTEKRTIDGGNMVMDPACRTFIPRKGALSASTPDGMVYFCSPACKDKFFKNPA